MTDSEDKALAEEISRLLTITKVFSDSFNIRHERTRNWRLIGLLMSIGQVQETNRFTARAFRDVIRDLVGDEGGSTSSMYPWQYKYAYEFKNPDGWFLEELPHRSPPREPLVPKQKDDTETGAQRRERRPNITTYGLTPLFRACEYAYVSNFLESRTEELGVSLPLQADDPRIRTLFKTIMVFQKQRYKPLWGQATEDLKARCVELKYDVDGLTKWAWRAPLWVIVLATWRNRLASPGQGFQSGDANRYATDALAGGEDAGECLEALSNERGCKILMKEKRGFEEWFVFNNEYESAMRAYVERLQVYTQELNEQVRKILR
jgi:hypothetical protein